MVKTTEPDKTYIIRLFRDMVRAHMAEGRPIEDLALYLDRVVARREREDAGR